MESFEVKNPKPARVWVALFYLEDGNIQDVIYKIENEIHCNCWISPLHAPEPTVDGMERKPHYHLEFIFDGKQSFDRISDLLNFLPICVNIKYKLLKISILPETILHRRKKSLKKVRL